ncbi:MAG TPA: ATP-binding protein [Acidimicrobiales bacterium]|nr:ATP-binding protein [Acidimicrobiales bacterium]
MPETLLPFVERRARRRVDELFTEEPVLVLSGPRTVGKSQLLKGLGRDHGVEVYDLDDSTIRLAVSADPSLYVAGPSPVCVDEWQFVETIVESVKAELNKDLRPGRFVLTGSTRSDARPILARALAGRYHEFTILPFSQGELDGVEERFLDLLLEEGGEALLTTEPSRETRAGYVRRIVAGGLPLAVARATGSRGRWFDGYIRDVMERDVKALRRIHQSDALPKLLSRLAARSAQILDVRNAIEGLGLVEETGAAYVNLLVAVHLVRLLPAWGTTLASGVARKPKVHLVDSGVASRMLRVSKDRLARGDPSAQSEFGHLLESFVVGELLKQTSWRDGIATSGHWSRRSRAEVDFILEVDDGDVFAFEIKAGTTLERADFAGLELLRDLLGPRFRAGIVLNLGTRSFSHGDRIFVLPVDALWRSYPHA